MPTANPFTLTVPMRAAATKILDCIASVGDPRHTLEQMYSQLKACHGMAERFADRYASQPNSGNFYYTMTVTLFEKKRAVEEAVLAAERRAIATAYEALPIKNFTLPCLRRHGLTHSQTFSKN